MMKVRIYQIDPDRDVDGAVFQSFEKIKGVVDRNIYDLIYEGTLYCKTLEGVKGIINYQRPKFYRGIDLGTSDVIEVVESDGVDPGFYFCDEKEFKKILFHPIEFEETETAPEKISVLYVRSGMKPEFIEIDNCPEALQELVRGDVQADKPFDNNVVLLSNRHGEYLKLPLNRAVYVPQRPVEMTYGDMKSRFYEAERNRKSLTGYVVFTQDSFTKEYSEDSRTYLISSNNKAFMRGIGGYSIYGMSLDVSDPCVRLDYYMANEHGGSDGWKIERCYMFSDEHELNYVVRGDFLLAYVPEDGKFLQSLPRSLAEQYARRFEHPERFAWTRAGIEVISENKKTDEPQR